MSMLHIDQGVYEYLRRKDAKLLDVRTPEEYREGHIPNSINLPLQEMQKAAGVLKDKEAPVFAYCHSGVRSGQAASMLKRMGYKQVTNIGGIMSYQGKVVK